MTTCRRRNSCLTVRIYGGLLSQRKDLPEELCAAIVEQYDGDAAKQDFEVSSSDLLVPGKTLEIRLQTIAEADETGEAKVFFELNGQPRNVRVPNRRMKAKTAARPKADSDDPNQIGAPMPGVVATISATTFGADSISVAGTSTQSTINLTSLLETDPVTVYRQQANRLKNAGL